MGKITRTGPVTLGVSAANILQGGGGDATKYDRIKHIDIVNRLNVPVTASLWLGASGGNAAGTELHFATTTIPANSSVPYYCDKLLKSTEYITGLASQANALTVLIESLTELATP